MHKYVLLKPNGDIIAECWKESIKKEIKTARQYWAGEILIYKYWRSVL